MVTRQPDSVSRTGEQRYRLFENLPICIVIADPTAIPAIILEVNRRAELVYGYTVAEMLGNPVIQLVSEESRPDVEHLLQRVQVGETVTAETRHRRRDGSTFPVRMVGTLDPIDRGHAILTVEDITAETERRSEADAIDAERRRIAHEIHDGVAQSLGALRFKSALWSHQASESPAALRGSLDELQDVLGAAIADLRRAIFALRPMDLESERFLPALTQLVTDFGEQNQILAQLEVSGLPESLPADYELPLFRVVQEGLNNINQHARASSVLVQLRVDSTGGVALSVRDNGRGFDPRVNGAANRRGHFGLRQMRERILDLGGTLFTHSAIGLGTELLITVPPRGRRDHRVND